MKMKKILLIILAVFSIFMFACDVKQEEEKVEKIVEVEGMVNTLKVGESANVDAKFYNVKKSVKEEVFLTPVWATTDAMVARIENGKVKAYGKGNAIISVTALEDEEYYFEFSISVTEDKAEVDVLMTAGELKEIEGLSFDNLSFTTTDDSIVLVSEGTLLAVREGSAKVEVYSNNKKVKTLNVSVNKYESVKASSKDIEKAQEILSSMTLEQKVGQMFIGSASGNTISSSARNAITNYHLGNFIFMGNNCKDPRGTGNYSIALQKLFVESNGVPALICIDQETGNVNRLNTGATRFLGNMALRATNDPHNAYLVGEAVGKELKNYGINFNLAPVLDVNNNPDNPIINCRSYGDDPVAVALFGTNMINGLKSQNVMSCSKHFPGHGNTSTDTHMDLPTITYSLEDLYSIELAPFIASIYTGIDAIMTTHIIFSAIDSEYPATLSKKVLTGLLRERIGYDGLIITDGMEMKAITRNFGLSQAAILAINAGADILCYTSVTDPMTAIPDVISAVNDGTIKLERIDDAVLRILLKKIKYGLLEDYLIDENFEIYETTSHSALNLSLAKQSVTLYKGDFRGLDKTKNTIIMSSVSSYDLGYSGKENSFAYTCSKYLKENGMERCDYNTISDMSSSNMNSYLEQAKSYDQIVIAIDSANTAQINFVNKLCKERSDVIVVALKLPYDYNHYENVNTFITIYDATPIMQKALILLMNGEYAATGKCSVKLNK